MAEARHVPERTCVACRTRRDKAALLRFVRCPDGSVKADPGGTLEGRGAYLCADGGCWQTALKRSSLQRALRTRLPQDITSRLEHGDLAAFGAIVDHVAPATITGGTHGS